LLIPENADLPIFFILSDFITIVFNFFAPEKAFFSMPVILLPIVTRFSFVFFLNAFFEIIFTF